MIMTRMTIIKDHGDHLDADDDDDDTDYDEESAQRRASHQRGQR